MSAGAQTLKSFAKSEFFDLKLFPKSVFKKIGGGPTPPGTPLGGQQGGFAPNYDTTRIRSEGEKRKRKWKRERRKPN